MQSLLRSIVAGPRSRHSSDLDLCYVTPSIIATSGPSATYPSLAYRNPLSSLVSFLDDQHGKEWCIWEFRAEGTGYPDEAVYNRIWHFPWPDHHPPPFGLVPRIMASMRDWLNPEDGGVAIPSEGANNEESQSPDKSKRVVVVHCKAGKGRSGSMAISYLITHEGWRKEDAIQRFTERRMRPGFGAGISIPSQKRWLDYVERWATMGGKMYLEREVEIIEVHVWGLREGVKIEVEGYVEEGRKIRRYHTFVDEERDDVGGAEGLSTNETGTQKGSGGFANVASGVVSSRKLRVATSNARARSRSPAMPDTPMSASGTPTSPGPASASTTTPQSATTHNDTLVPPSSTSEQADTISRSSSTSATSASSSTTPSKSTDPNGNTNTIFRPRTPIILPTSDINLAVEQRKGSFNTITSVAHVWFNAYFEGNGPENWQKMHTTESPDHLKRVDTHGFDENGTRRGHGTPKPEDSGVFTIEWEAMDGIKGSSKKGTKAFDRVAVVWRAVGMEDAAVVSDSALAAMADADGMHSEGLKGVPSIVIPEPEVGEPIQGTQASDWRGSSPVSAKVEGAGGGDGAQSEATEAGYESEDSETGVQRGVIAANAVVGKPDADHGGGHHVHMHRHDK